MMVVVAVEQIHQMIEFTFQDTEEYLVEKALLKTIIRV
jgi:hypothetical protein